jgi:hypothetical protein
LRWFSTSFLNDFTTLIATSEIDSGAHGAPQLRDLNVPDRIPSVLGIQPDGNQILMNCAAAAKSGMLQATIWRGIQCEV